jgi:hypothetical protein
MDPEYQRRLVADGYEGLQRRMEEEKDLVVRAEWLDGTLFVEMVGAAGPSEPYLVKIEPWLYPVGPWRVGFIDPSAQGERRLTVPDRDPRFWPYSQMAGAFGGFHVHFPGPLRVFICLPFTTEFFLYHGDQRWQPEVYDLARVVLEINREIKKAVHFSRWCKFNYRVN